MGGGIIPAQSLAPLQVSGWKAEPESERLGSCHGRLEEGRLAGNFDVSGADVGESEAGRRHTRST